MDVVDVTTLILGDFPAEARSLANEKEDLEFLKLTGCKNWPNTPFPIDERINQRVLLYDGDLEELKADAIVNPTNENLTQMGFVSHLAGPELEAYMRKRVKVCATGDVRISPGFKSNFKYIIHAVPPKYQSKYKTAAESALFHTYFRILESMIEKKIRSVVMPTLARSKCSLPYEENCLMQFRIIRRMLEKKCDDFDKIVIYTGRKLDAYRTLQQPAQPHHQHHSHHHSHHNHHHNYHRHHHQSSPSPPFGGGQDAGCMNSSSMSSSSNNNNNSLCVNNNYLGEDQDEIGQTARRLFHCYFPQTSIHEELACYTLDASLGGPNGEPVIPEREIRIKSIPSALFRTDSPEEERSIDLTSGLDLSTVVGKAAFTRMYDDIDAQRVSSALKNGPSGTATTTTTTTTAAASAPTVGVDAAGNFHDNNNNNNNGYTSYTNYNAYDTRLQRRPTHHQSSVRKTVARGCNLL